MDVMDDEDSVSEGDSMQFEQDELCDLACVPDVLEREKLQEFNNSTLVSRTLFCIFSHEEYFYDLFKRTGRNPMLKLSKIVRSEMIKLRQLDLGDFLEPPLINPPLTQLLLNDKVKCIYFAELPNNNPTAMKIATDFWFAMTNECPNLQTLVCKEGPSRAQKLKNNYGMLVFFSFCLHFKELQVLEMCNMECDYSRLSLLADSLPKLRAIRIKLGPKVTSEGIAALAKLKHLEEFFYVEQNEHPFCNVKHRRDFFHTYKLCLRLLPWLQISGSKRGLFGRTYYDESTGVFNYAWHRLKRCLPSQLGLKELTLTHCDAGLPVGVALPNLETLFLEWPSDNLQLNPEQLVSLRELVMDETKPLMLEQILNDFGHQLQKLVLMAAGTVNLNKVFQTCPKLQMFSVSDWDVMELNYPLNVCDLKNITELGFRQTHNYITNYIYYKRKSQHLLQILLAAPNLSKLSLFNIIFFEEDEIKLCKALQQRLILQHLEQLNFYYKDGWFSDAESDDEIPRQGIKKCCFSVIHCMTMFCPKLTDVKEVENDFDYSFQSDS